MTREDVDRWADERGEELLCADGFDDAIVGIGQRFSPCEGGGATIMFFVVYDRAKCIEQLVTRDGMSVDDAEEFFEFNTAGSYVGEATPCFLMRGE